MFQQIPMRSGYAIPGAGRQVALAQLWELHLQLFGGSWKNITARRTPEKLDVHTSSISKSKFRNNMRWDSQAVEYCAVILDLLGNGKSDNLRWALLEGKNPSRHGILYVFPGTPLNPDAIHSACRKVFAPPDQIKKVIFFRISELV